MKKRTSLLTIVMALFFVAIITIVFMVHPLSANAQSKEDIISTTLAAQGAADAVLVEDDPDIAVYAAEGLSVVFYYSETTGCRYMFDPNTGELKNIRSTTGSSAQQTDTYTVQSNNEPLSDEARKQAVLSYAADQLANVMFGQLQISSEKYNNRDYIYVINEYYNNMQTGTQLLIVCQPNGTVTSCSFQYGSIFTKNANDEIVLADSTPMIAEAVAKSTALEHVKELAAEENYTVDESSITCSMKAIQGLQFYEVAIIAHTASGYPITFTAQVDVHTAEILQVSRTI